MRDTTQRFSVITVFGISAALLFSHNASAAVDCDRLDLGNRVPTLEELTDCLCPSATRGVREVPEGKTPTENCERLHLGDRTPTVEELTECLKPSPTRGPSEVPEGKTAATEVGPPVASLRVRFEFGSYSLTSDSEAELDKVGQALRSPSLIGDAFLIEGHTDGVGSGDYNQTLSENRASAARQYLVEVVGIEPNRLRAVGRGEQHLLDPNSPKSSANRRVQIINLGKAN